MVKKKASSGIYIPNIIRELFRKAFETIMYYSKVHRAGLLTYP